MPTPDEQIFPHATGFAASTVELHQAPQDLTFYAGWFCPFVQRSWICLEEKGIPYQYKEVNPYKKEKEFLALNPKGLVPALEYQGRALYESLIICEFLDDAYPDHKPSMLPEDPYQKAYARIWIDFIGKSVLPNFMRLMQAQTEDKRDEARKELHAAMQTFAAEAKGPYFLGEQFSLVDAAIVPWILRDYILHDHRGYHVRRSVRNGSGMRSRLRSGRAWSRRKAWVITIALMLNVANFFCSTQDADKYEEIYGRYLRDEAQSEAAKAIRAGKPIP
ncbi:Glutathione transferase-like protein [Mycena indigotica]|uniref:Glutathione transferase-like protein n=1 Tax=Mycena indigotica TaxID=2126181 RepID=A0A8H6TE79_9AGAR|nr:Glutathione transferase-like protein [Mycena indigotica]KAF7315116.1 Glutathione transferase-like protein [Mycena indigotica]